MKPLGILRFPGTNCDRDVWRAAEAVGLTPQWLWHEDSFDPKGYVAYVVPGGFSYGDYLRCGALAAKAPVMNSLSEAVQFGAPVLGICNGFQILCEAGLLPGVLVRNRGQRFVDRWVELQLQNSSPYFARGWGSEQVARVPIAHGEGCYYIDDEGYKKLLDRGQVWWRYTDNPNGSRDDIAGVMSEKKNVAALMPHPERAMTDWMGGQDGRAFFETLLSF